MMLDPNDSYVTPENTKDYKHLNLARLITRLVTDPDIENFEISSNSKKFGDFGDLIIETRSAKNEEKYAIQFKYDEEFSIKKYFESFKAPATEDPHKFILVTNADLAINNNDTITLEDYTIAVSKCNLPSLFETFKNEGHCFKFTVVSNGKAEDKTFFDRLFLCSNQTKEEQLKVSMTQNFQNKFYCTETEADKFLDFISKQDGTKLDLDLMKHVIALLLLSPFMKPLTFGTVSDKAIKLKTAIDSFDVTICEEASDSLRSLWGYTKIETKEAQELITKYRLDIEKIEDMTDEERTTLLWLMQKCPLIVDGNATTLKAIQLCRAKKYVLVGRKLQLKKQLKHSSLLQNLSDIKIHPDIFKDIMTPFKISIQGKKEISLKTLFGDMSKIDITINDLLHMLDQTVIGDVKETLPAPYISRFLSKTIIKHRYLRNMSSDAMVVINCMKKGDHIKKLRRRFNTVNFNQDWNNRRKDLFLNATIYIAEDECSKEEFEEFCQERPRVQKIHHLALTDEGNLEWLRSKGEITDLQKYCKQETQFIEEREFYYSKVESNVTLVVSEAGMGKSVLMASMKNNCAPNLWSVLLGRKDISALCQYLQGKKCDKVRFENFVLQNKCDKDLDRKLLKMLFEKNQVIYLWDGLDEASPEEMKTITDLISKISKENTRHWITSRDYLKGYLENKFNVFARFLKGFSDKESMFYMRQRLKDKFVEREIQQLVALMGDKLIQNSLNVFMVTELLQESEMCSQLFLSDHFNVADLFRCFIDKKFGGEKNIYFEKFQKAAVGALLPEIRIDCDDFLTEIKKNDDPFGMIVRVDKNGAQFLHRAFAEYFVASYLVENYRDIHDLENILFKIEHISIRFLFDLLLARDSKAHLAALYNNFKLLKECKDLKDCKDLGGRSPLHLACSWGLIYPRVPLKCRQKNYFIVDDKSLSFVPPESEDYIEMIQYLLNVCDPLETDEIYSLNSVAYAEKSDNLFAKTLFLLNQKKQFLRLTDDVSLVSVVFYSAVYGYNQVIDLYKEFPLIQMESSGDTLLHPSVMDIEYLRKLLEHASYRKNIDKRNKDGETPLFFACAMGLDDSVQLLIDQGADIDMAADFRITPLHTTCIEGYASIVKLLVKSGANILARDLRGMTPLHTACFSGNFEIVDFLLKCGCNKNVTDYDGYTPLHFACQNGHKKVVNLLIRKGAKLNATDEDKCTPLHLACQNGHKGVVQLLLSEGANIHLADINDWTPFFYACLGENVEVIRLLLEFEPSLINKKCNGLTPLHLACARGSYRVVLLLIQYQASLNGIARNGAVPLQLACIGNHLEIVQLLIKKGVNVNYQDHDGHTALHYSAANGNADVVQMLLTSGARIGITDNTQWTPLHTACKNNNVNVVEILLDSGASIVATTQENWTPLHVACQHGSTEVAKFLLEKNAPVYTVDDRGRIPLHLASRFGHVEIVKMLIAADSTIDFREALVGATPLHFATFRCHTEVCRLLLEAGADPNAADTTGVTVVKLAFDVDAVDIMNLLVKHGGRTNGLDLSMMGRMMHQFRFQLELR